jgi:ubiquinone/menaquinone biosynthesis C-methylase UbiE
MPKVQSPKPKKQGREAARGEGPPRASGEERGEGPPRLNKEGWEGWDDYADFYDWENAQTLDRRDVRFWRDMAGQANGAVLELGCGTGRVTLPLARTGAHVVGVDRSEEMLSYARRRAGRAKLRNLSLVRADIRALPFRHATRFDLVVAPYGILQSLVRDSDLKATLASVAGVLSKDGVFGLDLVPDLPAWSEYRNRVRFRGKRRGGGSRITLVESVRQDRDRGLTIFDQQYVERRGLQTSTRKFSLVFRTISIRQMTRRLEHAGFCVRAVLGDYNGAPWDSRADVWLILAQKR